MVETAHSTTGTGGLRCVVVTPEKAVLDAPTDFVALPMYDGELGVLSGRQPLIGRLGCGELRIGQGTHASKYFVDGGFAQVRGDVVTVLTPRAIKAEDIKVAEAEQALQQALTAPATEMASPAAAEGITRRLRIAWSTAGVLLVASVALAAVLMFPVRSPDQATLTFDVR